MDTKEKQGSENWIYWNNSAYTGTFRHYNNNNMIIIYNNNNNNNK
jgi:hypothetical protein